MNYIGKKVFHKGKFGKGIVVSQNKNESIVVQFESEPEEKMFLIPSCFQSFLRLVDEHEINQGKNIDSDLRKEAKDKSTPKSEKPSDGNKKFRRTDLMMTGSFEKKQRYVSVDDFYKKQEDSIISEIVFLKKNGGKRIRILDGKLVEVKSGRYIYSFESESELNIPDNTQITLWVTPSEGVAATLVCCDEFNVIITTSVSLEKSISSIEFSAEQWRLLDSLNERLQELKTENQSIVNALICDGWEQIEKNRPIDTGQKHAIERSLSQPITFIWGPPGTGKTEILAEIAMRHMENGNRVLMLSYSNVSVDSAMLRVFSKNRQAAEGVLVRYGYPKSKELLNHEYLSSYNLTLRNHPELFREREELLDERAKLSRASSRYAEIGERLGQIKEQVQKEEKQTVFDASFVATTVSKGIIDKAIYENQFDTVIFDEASMAYVPQIVFSAGLAGKHFVCIGDFAQLPPIVQSKSGSDLNTDIFAYCGITDAVLKGFGHKWLCMLDTQYRMHPAIADFSGDFMYRGLLKSGKNMADKQRDIVRSRPFSGEVLQLADLSGMPSVCIKTADHSRINVLSALISMGLAQNAAERCSVGIITPYNAQSRLLHTMAKDIDLKRNTQKKITCATVHQFQGSEKDIILYDAVDCYRMKYPGKLLTSTSNGYANRLYNVAITRAKGKVVSVANADYMIAKNLSKDLLFRRMIEELQNEKADSRGKDLLREASGEIISFYEEQDGTGVFFNDVKKAKREIYIDIPGSTLGDSQWFRKMGRLLKEAKQRGVKVFIRSQNKESVDEHLQPFAIENKYVSNPVTIIDKTVVWFGMPLSDLVFVSEGKSISAQYHPEIRFEGRNFARSLFGYLSMNQTVDDSEKSVPSDESEKEECSTFASYVVNTVRCEKCGGKMRLKKNKKGRFFLACSNYPQCENTKLVDVETVDDYLYSKDRSGKRCPQDKTSLEAKVGRFGVYAVCNGIKKHFYKLDEI